jgi:transcriptional regulator with XRE-family HTH domain
MTTLKEQRTSLGMSQAHVAFLLGTQQANISAYESGTLTPGSVVEERMAELLRLHQGTAHTGTWLGTCASHARAIKEFLAHRADHGPRSDLWLMRYVIGMNDALRQRIGGQGESHQDASTQADVRLFLAPPQSTGDHRADALLAGMAVHWARSAGLERSPAWTRAHHLYLAEPWWLGTVTNDQALRAQAFANGVPSLRARGIFLDRRTLESV